MEDTISDTNNTKANLNDVAIIKKEEEVLYSLDEFLKNGVEEGEEHPLYSVAVEKAEKLVELRKTGKGYTYECTILLEDAISLLEKALKTKDEQKNVLVNVFVLVELAHLYLERTGGVDSLLRSKYTSSAFRMANQAAGLGRTLALRKIAEKLLVNGHNKEANHFYELAMYYSFYVKTLMELAELKKKCEIKMIENGQPNYRQITSIDCLSIAAYKGSCEACLELVNYFNCKESMFRDVATVYYELIHHNCKCDDDHRQKIDYEFIGKYYNNFYDREKSIYYYEIAISKLDENDDARRINIFEQIAYSYNLLGNYLLAISYYEKFISLYEKIKTKLDGSNGLDGNKKISYYEFLYRLAKHYYDGVHVEKDYSKTLHYLSLNDFSGNYHNLLTSQREAKKLLALCYYNGYGVPVDMMKAHDLFTTRKMKDKYFFGLCNKFPNCDSCERCEKFKKNPTKQNLICPDYPECKNDDCEYGHQLGDSKFRTELCRNGEQCKFHKKGKCTFRH